VPGATEGSLFSAELTQAVLPNLDPTANNILMVSTFNEWHEDTQIEPTIVANPTTTDSSGVGTYAQGYSYSGYSNLYLDLLHSATVSCRDYNRNGIVDAADYIVWRKTLGQSASAGRRRQRQRHDRHRRPRHLARPLRPNRRQRRGASVNAAVSEPATPVLLMLAAAGWCLRRGRDT